MPRSNRPRRSGRRLPAGGRSGAPDAGRDEGPDDGWVGGQGRGAPFAWSGTAFDLGGGRLDEQPDGTWAVRQVTGAAATKTYRCPGCQQEILPGTAHLVAWPAETPVGAFGGASDRRHWHTPCWHARGRRVRRPR